MTAGVRRPVLLVHAGARKWPPERRRVVLLHELAHVRRADWLTLVAAEIAGAIYWFHPLVWLARREARRSCERACDDLVLDHGTKPSVYAAHLLGIVRSLKPATVRALPSRHGDGPSVPVRGTDARHPGSGPPSPGAVSRNDARGGPRRSFPAVIVLAALAALGEDAPPGGCAAISDGAPSSSVRCRQARWAAEDAVRSAEAETSLLRQRTPSGPVAAQTARSGRQRTDRTEAPDAAAPPASRRDLRPNRRQVVRGNPAPRGPARDSCSPRTAAVEARDWYGRGNGPPPRRAVRRGDRRLREGDRGGIPGGRVELQHRLRLRAQGRQGSRVRVAQEGRGRRVFRLGIPRKRRRPRQPPVRFALGRVPARGARPEERGEQGRVAGRRAPV